MVFTNTQLWTHSNRSMQLRSSHTSDHSSVNNALLFHGFWFVHDLACFVLHLTTIYNPPIKPGIQFLMHSSSQETQNSVARHYKLLNSPVIATSLSFSFFANRACVSASISYVVSACAICFQSALISSADYSSQGIRKVCCKLLLFVKLLYV